MLYKFTLFISNLAYKKKYIKYCEVDKLRFGLEVIISQFVVFAIVLLIAYFLNLFIYGVLFTMLFAFLRSQSDGLHANTFVGCIILTNLSFLCCVSFEIFVIPKYINLINMILILVVLYFNHRYQNKNSNYYKLSLSVSIFSILIFFMKFYNFSIFILIINVISNATIKTNDYTNIEC